MTKTDEQRIASRIEEAREKALKQAEDYISSLYAEGQEKVSFWFNGFAFWNKSTDGGAEDLWRYLHEQDLHTDPWIRAVWSLSSEQALKIAHEVEEWNAHWEYDIAGKFAEEMHALDPEWDQNLYYNAYHLSFSPATGTEHTVTVSTGGRYTAESWQQ